MRTTKVNPYYLNSDLDSIKEAKILLQNLLTPKEREDMNSRQEDVLSLLEELEQDLEGLNVPLEVKQLVETHFGCFPDDYTFICVPANLFKHAGEKLAVLPEYPLGYAEEGVECVGHHNVRQIFLTRLLQNGPTAKVFEKLDAAEKSYFVLADHDEQKLYQVDW